MANFSALGMRPHPHAVRLCVLCKLKLFGQMSDTHNKLQYGNK